MTTNGEDPHRVLGVARDATDEEIKRAYRGLAKRHHPDADQGSVARFLEIQAAYEALVGGDGATARHGAAGGAWGAAWGSRRHAQPGGPAAGAGPGDRAAPGSSWARRPAGTRARRPSPAAGGGPAGPDAGERTGPAAPRGTAAPGGRPHGRRRATLGSTSYDDAEEIFEPGWSGAAWYGPSSGTYWTLNPKEYADPRKHGPEYLARARRRSGASSAPPDAGAPAAEPSAETRGDASASPRPAAAGMRPDGPSSRERTASSMRTPDRDGPPPGSPAPGVPRSWRGGAWTAAVPGTAAEPPFHHEPGVSAAAVDADAPRRPIGAAAQQGVAGPATRGREPGIGQGQPTAGPGPASRVTLALVGWLVPGLALAAAAGLPGGVVATLPLQAAGVALLALAPRAAWAGVGGGLALVLAGVPIVALVVALGGSVVPGGPAPAPAVVLAALAWAAGCAVLAAGRVAPYPWRQEP